MRRMIFGLAALAALAACSTPNTGATPKVSAADAAAAAIADSRRPANDTARDANRKPAESLAFAGVKPGDKVGELLPGGGYFTRLFAVTVGDKGHLYAFVNPPPPPSSAPAAPDAPKPVPIGQRPIDAVAAQYPNVTVETQDFTKLSAPAKLDLVWTSQNYHDMHLKRLNVDVAAVNKAIFNLLKPGGYYIVLDHAAADGSGLSAPDTLHRIDPAVVKAEVEAAGFKYVGESTILRNPADDHSKIVFDPSVRGKTDQFIYKFQKP